MERVTISVSDEFAAELSTFMAAHRYENRSQRVGWASAHVLLKLWAEAHPTRLTATHHAHRQLHVAVLRGKHPQVRELASSIAAERGVVHGALSLIPTSAEGIGDV